jgi:hypothetical protein
MAELAERHWHTYTLLEETLRGAVDNRAMELWDRQSLRHVRALIRVIAQLGLKRSGEMLQRELKCDLAEAIRAEIVEALNEFGATLDDPYSGMRSQ